MNESEGDVGGGDSLLSEVFSISEKQFNKYSGKRRRASVNSDDYVLSSDGGSDSSYNSEDSEDSYTDKEQKKKPKKQTVKKPIKCRYCFYSSYRQYYVDKHERTHIASDDLICKVCDQHLPDIATLENHIKCHFENHKTLKKDDPFVKVYPAPPKTLCCTICNYKTMAAIEMKLHIRGHVGKPIRCPKCPYAAVDHILFNKHLRSHEYGTRQYDCDLCNASFTNGYHFDSHQYDHLKEENGFICRICPFKCVALV